MNNGPSVWVELPMWEMQMMHLSPELGLTIANGRTEDGHFPSSVNKRKVKDALLTFQGVSKFEKLLCE